MENVKNLLTGVIPRMSDCLNIITEGKEVSVSLRDVERGGIDGIPEALRGPCLLSEGDIGGLSTRIVFLVPDTLVYVGLMLGQDEAEIAQLLDSGFGDSEQDAFGEAMNQVFGQLGLGFADGLGIEAPGRSGVLKTVDLSGDDAQELGSDLGDDLLIATMDLSIEGYDTSTAMMLWSADRLEEMASGAASAQSPSAPEPSEAVFPMDSSATPTASEGESLDYRRVLDLEVPIKVVLAGKQMDVRDVLELNLGSVIEFPKCCDEFLDFYVGNKCIAQGEAAKQGEHFCLQIKKIGTPTEIVRSL